MEGRRPAIHAAGKGTGTRRVGYSSLRFMKIAHRSTMSEERLNALLLLFIHRDIELDNSKILDIFAYVTL